MKDIRAKAAHYIQKRDLSGCDSALICEKVPRLFSDLWRRLNVPHGSTSSRILHAAETWVLTQNYLCVRVFRDQEVLLNDVLHLSLKYSSSWIIKGKLSTWQLSLKTLHQMTVHNLSHFMHSSHQTYFINTKTKYFRFLTIDKNRAVQPFRPLRISRGCLAYLLSCTSNHLLLNSFKTEIYYFYPTLNNFILRRGEIA